MSKTPTFFSSSDEFRTWLETHHEKEKELLVGFYKVDSGKACMTWSQSVEEALCYGWIDGVRKSVDKESYTIRFAPRKKGSIWSKVTIQKMQNLIKEGRIQASGLAIYHDSDPEKASIYSFEKEVVAFSAAFEKEFQKNKVAWSFFISQAHSWQKTMTHWIMGAKQEATQLKRLQELIQNCEAGKRM